MRDDNSVFPSLQEEKKKSKKSDDKLPLADKEYALCKWIDGESSYLIPPKIPFKGDFYFWKPAIGEPQILEYDLEQRIMRQCSVDEMKGKLAIQVMSLPQHLRLSFRQCKDVVERWKYSNSRKRLKDWPSPVGFKSQQGFFFSRLSFDPADQAILSDFPIIAEMLSRMSHPDRFCQMLGSAFDPVSSRKQVLWLYGDGNSGKSFLLNNVVSQLLGGDVGTATFSGEALSGSHWKEPLLGKSLLVVNEAASKFLRTESFKSLTGDDIHMINPKGLKMFQGQLQCRVFFSSNEQPEIPNDQAIKNRLIVCKMTEFLGKKLRPSDLEKRIEGELAAFVRYCIDLYKRLEGEFIPTESEELTAAIESHEEELQLIFDCNFVLDSNSRLTSKEFQLAIQNDLTRTRISLQRFRKFIKEQYGIEPGKKTRVGIYTERFYVGLKASVNLR